MVVITPFQKNKKEQTYISPVICEVEIDVMRKLQQIYYVSLCVKFAVSTPKNAFQNK